MELEEADATEDRLRDRVQRLRAEIKELRTTNDLLLRGRRGPPPRRPASLDPKPYYLSFLISFHDRKFNAPAPLKLGEEPKFRTKLRALYDFGGSGQELSFSFGDEIKLGSCSELDDEYEWIYCKDKNGVKGYVPKAYVSLL
ncbi:SH3 domain protein [Ceratobasidium sp. AG-Ba]|nr:SH3 domain protein [Ceratobasidium sp. AG-Ba]